MLGQHLPKSVPWALKMYLNIFKTVSESQVLTTLGDLVHMAFSKASQSLYYE